MTADLVAPVILIVLGVFATAAALLRGDNWPKDGES